MSTPTYVVKKVGDQYITVAKDSCAGVGAAWIAGGACLGLFGLHRRGVVGGLALLAGSGMIARGALGYNPMALCCGKTGGRDGGGSESPSYQNDGAGRASQLPEDLVDEQSMESFPASDPPARSGTVGVGKVE